MTSLLLSIQLFRLNEVNPFRTLNENVLSSQTVKNLKDILSNKVEGEIVRVQFSGQELDPDRTLASYDIRSGITLQVVVGNEDNFIHLNIEIQSVSANQRTLQIKVKKTITTEELMRTIVNKIPFNTDNAYLSCRGQTLQAGKTLKDQNVRNNDSISVLMRQRGG